MQLTPNTLSAKISQLVKEGYPQKQAIAIAYTEMRIAWRDKHPVGKFPVWLTIESRGKNPIKSNKKKEYMKFIKYSLIPEYEMKKSGYATDFDTIYQILSGNFNVSEAKNFLRYLRKTIIPDSKEAGYFSTAKDLQTGANYIAQMLRGKNPISEKTAHKLRKAAPKTFMGMTDEEIKRAVKVKKNPVRALKKPYIKTKTRFFFVDEKIGNTWKPLATFQNKFAAFDYAKAYGKQSDNRIRVTDTRE